MDDKVANKQADHNVSEIIEIPTYYKATVDQGTNQPIDKDKQYMKLYNWNERQMMQIREAFNEYDIMNLETIPAHDFGNAVRLAGQTPTEADIQEMLKHAILDGCLTMDEFVKAIGRRGWVNDGEVLQEFEDALRYFDKNGDGWLDADEMRRILKTYGEPLDDDDVNELIKLVDTKSDGRLECNEMVKKLVANKT